MRRRLQGLAAAGVATACLGAAALAAPPASAGLLSGGLLGGLLCPVTNTLTGVLSAGWDDGATTTPSTMSDVESVIGADQLYSSGYTGQGIGVALIDSGVAPVQGLTGTGKVINGPDLSLESQSSPYPYLDDYGHGTHMAGIIAGNDGSSGTFQGVAPGAHLVVLKTAAFTGAVDVSQILAAIDWVVQHRNDPGMNIRVLNLSFGTESLQSYQLDPIAFAVENAWKHGIVTVVSAGNDGTNHGSLTDPAVDPYVLAVGAANLNESNLLGCATVAPFSSRGNGVRNPDIIAPGVSIVSLRDPGSYIDDNHPGAVVNTRFFRGSGTSQAAAVASGAVALLLSARPSLTPDQVKALFDSTASPLGLLDGSAEGHGMLQVGSAFGASVPWGSTQSFSSAAGTGSLETARGGIHVSMNGVALTGEQDIMGSPWKGSVWAPLSAKASAWTGGTWNGRVWSGSCWCGTSWAGTTWSGAGWTGAGWTGAGWTGAGWTGAGWTGAGWTGAGWTS